MSSRRRVVVTLCLGLAVGAPPVSGGSWPRATVRDGQAATARIAGVVVTAGASPRPVRGAMVSATWLDSTTQGARPADPARGAITDNLGRFVFDRLAPGTYRLQATKPGFIDGEYGATAPAGTGTPIAVEAGDDVADLILALARGGVITGTLRHINGEPAEGVAVGARTSASARSAIRQVVTDDRGTYRLHGLPPGQYFVVASPPPAPGATPIQVMSTEDVETALRELEERSRLPGPRSGAVGAARPGAEVQPGAPATFGYAPVFYPGTTNAAEAVPVRVDEGEERSGADFSLVLAGTTSISGVVVGPDGRPAEGAVLSIAPAGAAGGVDAVPRGASQADGTFLIVNTPPGRYVVSARVTPLTLALAAGRPADVRPGASRASLWAIEEVDVGPAGLAGLTLALRPSMTLSGEVVFEGDAATPRPPAVRVSLVNEATGGSTLAATASTADGTFEIGGILPGTYTIETRIPGPARWWPRSAVADGRDLLDFPPAFDAGSIDLTGVVLTLSGRFTELSGTVEGGTGIAATEPAVLVFPADRVFWQPRSRRIAWTKPDASGGFVFRGLPPGQYLMVLLPASSAEALRETAEFEPLLRHAVKVVLTEGQRTVLDLTGRIREGR